MNELAEAPARPAVPPRDNRPVVVPLVPSPTPDPAPALPAVDPALLRARPRGLMIEYTSRCNLRCRYCSKASPGDDGIPGRDMDMGEQTLQDTLALIARLGAAELLLAGTGESTFHQHWRADLPRLVAAGKAAHPACYVHLNSNFAQRYGEEDFAVLAQLDGIVVSIDTADAGQTRQVRAKSDLALVCFNLLALTAWCRARGLRTPRLMVNATLHHAAAAGVFELVQLLAQLPVERVSISDMVELEASRVHGLRALHAEDRATFVAAVQGLQKAIHFAQQHPTLRLDVQPHLLQRINALVAELNAGGPAAAPAAAAPGAAPGRTKLCLQPWTRFTIAADGALYPCCVTDMPPVGHIARDGEGIDGPAMRGFRHRLLSGHLPAVCRDCSNAGDCGTAELEAAVRALGAGREPARH